MTRLDDTEREPDGRPEVRLRTDHRHHTVAQERGTQMDDELTGVMARSHEIEVALFAKAFR